MSTPPVKPKFVLNITWGQRLLASISCSLFIFALITLVPWITDPFFKPNFEFFLSVLRVGFAAGSFVCGALVGIQQINDMIKWLFAFYGYVKRFKDDELK